MKKRILVIGGGISGLSVLHHLKKKYQHQSDVEIRLLEKNAYLGGTALTEKHAHCLFEKGPNGFLDSNPSTLELAKELGLEGELIWSNPAAKIRYISIDDKLHRLPNGPKEFAAFPFLSIRDKFRILMEPFLKPGTNPDETVAQFGTRRLGRKFVQYFLNPMVAGIFGGDAEYIHLKEAFPRIYALEQTHGSLIRAMLHLRKVKKKEDVVGQPKGSLVSFRHGMSQLSETIGKKYYDCVELGVDVGEIFCTNEGYVVKTNKGEYGADELFICTPAFTSAKMLAKENPALAKLLEEIEYASIAIVGLVYERSKLSEIPKGFGYLNPSSEHKNVLGVLWPGNIFAGRSADSHFLFHIMLGGSRNPNIATKSTSELIEMSKAELKNIFGIDILPSEAYVKIWPKAIPQYTVEYARIKKLILHEMQKMKSVSFVANYLNGIGVNDCTTNAAKAVNER